MKRAILATLLVVCPALPTLAADLEFSGGGEVEYDDNVFRSETNKDDDVLFRLRPGLRIYEDHGDDLNYSAGYEAPVEFSVENTSEFDEVDHVATGFFQYHANDRFQLFGSEQFGYLRSTLRQPDVNSSAAFDSSTLEFTDQRDRVKTNDASLGMNYSFSPRTVGRVVASSDFFDSSRPDRAKVWSVSGSADAQYKLTLKHQIGAGAGYSYQDFGDRLNIPGSETNSYRIFGTWRWAISETLALDLTAGPAYLETDQHDASAVRVVTAIPAIPLSDGNFLVSDIASCGSVSGRQVAQECQFDLVLLRADATGVIGQTVQMTNLNPAGESDSETTGFVDLSISQRWSPTLATGLRYSRQQGGASGLGGTVIVDAVSLSNTWDFWERWQLAVRGDYARRESAFDIAQTFDEVTGVALGPGGTLIATRDLGGGVGTSFSSKQNVKIDTDSWGVAGRITHQLFKTTSLYVQVRYTEQNSRSDSLGADSDFENFLATFGVRHVFEPIPLW